MFQSLLSNSLFLVVLSFYACSSSSEKPCIKRVDVKSTEEESIRSYDKDLPLNLTKHILRLELKEGQDFLEAPIASVQNWVNDLPKGSNSSSFDHEYMLIRIQYFSCKKEEDKGAKYNELIHKRMTEVEELITDLNGKTNGYPDALILKSSHLTENEQEVSDYIKLSIGEIKKTHIPPITNNNEVRTKIEKDLMADKIIQVSVTVDSTIYTLYEEDK